MRAHPASRGRCQLCRVLHGTRRASQSPDGSASRTRFGRVAALGVSLLPGPASRLPGSRSPTRPRGPRRGAAARRPPRSSTARAAAPPTASRRPRRLSSTQIRSALRRGGRQRSIERRAAEVRDVLRSPQLEAPAAVSKAFAASTVRPSGRSARSTAASRNSRPPWRPLLSSTRTPRSTAPCQGSASSSAPACSESSGMAASATTQRSPVGTTPVLRR